MSRFKITNLPLYGLKCIDRKHIGDQRGSLSRLFCADELAAAGWTKPIAQINHTFTARQGTVRGMHYQNPPHAEMKLVSCIRGEVWDVVVDLREGSSTFLGWHAERISAEKGRALLIPEGFAHGFQALTDNVELIYCHSEGYVAQEESGLNPKDPELGIKWPIAMAELSVRDAGRAWITKDFKGINP
jgi:dTDP-4-dehydrorhamnose 3,5-epimerase